MIFIFMDYALIRIKLFSVGFFFSALSVSFSKFRCITENNYQHLLDWHFDFVILLMENKDTQKKLFYCEFGALLLFLLLLFHYMFFLQLLFMLDHFFQLNPNFMLFHLSTSKGLLLRIFDRIK